MQFQLFVHRLWIVAYSHLLYTWVKLVKFYSFNFVQVGLLNVDGYYNSLLSFIDKAVDEGFVSPTARRIIVSAPTARELVRLLEVNKTS